MSHEMTPADNTPKDPALSNKMYDFLKSLVQIYLPALGTLYSAVAVIWGLPSATEVVGTIVAVDTFGGVVLAALTSKYNNSDAAYDGTIHVVTDPDSGFKTATMVTNTPNPSDIVDKETATFRVTTVPPPPDA